MLEIRNVSLLFNDKIVFKRINHKFHKGEFIYVTGANGSGKTSLLRLISGHYVPTQGKILIDNNKIKKNVSLFSRNSKSFLMRLTVKENLNFFYNLLHHEERINKDRLNQLIKIFEINSLLNNEVMTLSSGQLQKISILRGFLKNPRILLFDEIFTSLDQVTKNLFIDFYNEYISEHNAITLWASHNENEMCIKNYKQIRISNNNLESIN